MGDKVCGREDSITCRQTVYCILTVHDSVRSVGLGLLKGTASTIHVYLLNVVPFNAGESGFQASECREELGTLE